MCFSESLKTVTRAGLQLKLAIPGMKEVLPIREGAAGFVEQLRGLISPRISHAHDELEINVVTEGEAVYLVDGRRVRLVKGSVLNLPSGREHLLVDTSTDFHMWILVTRSRPRMIGPECWTLRAADTRLLGNVCRELFQTPSTALLNAGLEFCIELLAKHAASTSTGELGASVHPAVWSAARHLRHAPDTTLGELAMLVEMSASRLGRLFKSQMGVPLSRYRNRIRLQRAQQLLEKTRANTLQVALQCGFGSYAQFYRVFREETGVNPRTARQLGAR